MVSAPLTTPSPLPDGGSTADKVVQYCKTLATDPTLRMLALAQSSFASDLSPEAQAALPGLDHLDLVQYPWQKQARGDRDPLHRGRPHRQHVRLSARPTAPARIT